MGHDVEPHHEAWEWFVSRAPRGMQRSEPRSSLEDSMDPHETPYTQSNCNAPEREARGHDSVVRRIRWAAPICCRYDRGEHATVYTWLSNLDCDGPVIAGKPQPYEWER